jgi:hypothetical protein
MNSLAFVEEEGAVAGPWEEYQHEVYISHLKNGIPWGLTLGRLS